MSAYGYCRCSTNERKQDIDGQKRMILKYGVPEENIFWEYGSGTKREREKLNLLLDTVKQGNSIYTTEVSRLSRSTEHLCEIIDIVYKKKIKLVIGSFVVDCTSERPDPMTEGMLKMWGVFAEMERNMICARIKYGIDNARAKGKTLGRPKTTEQNIPNVFYRYLQKYQKKEISISEFARLCDCSRTTIYKYLNITEKE